MYWNVPIRVPSAVNVWFTVGVWLRAAPIGPAAGFAPRGQRFALHVLHHQEVGVAGAADVVQRADVRVIERGDRACLALEALAQLGRGREMGRKHLDRHVAPEARIAGAVDLAHAAGAERAEDLVRA
jgi:hypothetical protein